MPHTLTDLPGKGTLLKLSISSTFTTIGQRVSLEGPSSKLGIRNPTHLDSTYVAKRPTIPDLGQIKGKLWYDPNDAVHGPLRAKVYSPPTAPDLWKLIYADGDTTPSYDAFSGYLTEFSVTGMEVEGTLEADFTIELTDQYAFTAGTP